MLSPVKDCRRGAPVLVIDPFPIEVVVVRGVDIDLRFERRWSCNIIEPRAAIIAYIAIAGRKNRQKRIIVGHKDIVVDRGRVRAVIGKPLLAGSPSPSRQYAPKRYCWDVRCRQSATARTRPR